MLDRPHPTHGSPVPEVRRSDSTGQRVLVVAPQPFYEDRGTPIATRHLLEALSELGVAVDVLTYPVGADVNIPSVRYFRVGNPLGFEFVPVGLSFRKLFLDVLLSLELYRRLRRESYLWIQAVEEMAFMAVLPGRRPPVVYDMQSSLPEQLKQWPGFALRPVQSLLRAAERWLLLRSDQILCSAGLAEQIRAYGPGVAVEEWRFPGYAPSVSPAQIEKLRGELDLPPEARVVLYGGTFEAYQGLRNLLAEAPRVLQGEPEAFFVLVGARDTEQLASFERLLSPADRDRVRIVLRTPRDRIASYLELADVLVSPRSEGGNAPLKIFEYMAAGKPIVATDIPAHRRILNDRLALLVPQRPDAIAEGILGLLRDRERAARLGDAAKKHAADHLGWERFVEQVRSIYWRMAEVGSADQGRGSVNDGVIGEVR